MEQPDPLTCLAEAGPVEDFVRVALPVGNVVAPLRGEVGMAVEPLMNFSSGISLVGVRHDVKGTMATGTTATYRAVSFEGVDDFPFKAHSFCVGLVGHLPPNKG